MSEDKNGGGGSGVDCLVVTVLCRFSDLRSLNDRTMAIVNVFIVSFRLWLMAFSIYKKNKTSLVCERGRERERERKLN